MLRTQNFQSPCLVLSGKLEYRREEWSYGKPNLHQSLSGLPAHVPAPPGGPCVPATAPIFPDPLERPVRLTGSADSGGYPTGCQGCILRPANQLRRLVRFADQMAAAGMRNGRSHSRSQMRIDTSCDVAKLAVTLAQGRVLEPERGFNPFTRSSLSGQRPAEHSSRRTPCGNGQNGSPLPAMTLLHIA